MAPREASSCFGGWGRSPHGTRRDHAMACPNHPERSVSKTCTICGQAFCPACVVLITGSWYCGRCKYDLLRGREPTGVQNESRWPLNEDARGALVFVCIAWGLMILWGLILPLLVSAVLAVIAVVKANQAFSSLRDDGQQRGNGMAVVGLVASCTLFGFLVLHVLSMLRGF